MVTMTERFEPNPQVLAQRLDDDTIILVDLQTDRIFELNRTGARLWELLVEGCENAQLRSALLSEFAVDEPVLAAEVERLLNRLSEENLVIARS